jgi:RecA-family ATPase
MKPESLSELTAWRPPAVRHIISQGLLLPETKMILFGQYDTWKSMLAIDMGFSIASGQKWLGHKTYQSKVLIIQTEIPKYLFRERVMKYAKGHSNHPINIYFQTDLSLKLNTSYGAAALDRWLTEIDPDVTLVDPIYRTFSGAISDSTEVNKLIDNLNMLSNRHHTAFVLIGHSGKVIYSQDGSVIDRGADALMGSSYFQDWADTIVEIHPVSSESVRLSFPKTRNAENIVRPVLATIDRDTLSWSVASA